MPAWFSLNDLYYILPELVLAGGGLVVLIATALTPRSRQAWLSWLGIGGSRGLGRGDDRRHAGRANQRGARPAVG